MGVLLVEEPLSGMFFKFVHLVTTMKSKNSYVIGFFGSFSNDRKEDFLLLSHIPGERESCLHLCLICFVGLNLCVLVKDVSKIYMLLQFSKEIVKLHIPNFQISRFPYKEIKRRIKSAKITLKGYLV